MNVFKNNYKRGLFQVVKIKCLTHLIGVYLFYNIRHIITKEAEVIVWRE